MEWFNYLLKVSACSAFFFAFYLLVLRKLTFFKINRFYLLFTLLLGFVIPTLQFTVERELAAAPIIEAPVVVQNEDLTEQFSLLPTTAPVVSLPVEEAYNWFKLLPFLYITVVFGLLGLATWRLLQLIKHAKQNTQEINGLKLVHKSNGFTNCSFFNYVFIDENSLTESELQIMLRHEEVHAKQYHSVDKIILIIVKAVLWFNPIVYLYDKALEQIHEYEADEVTSRNFGTASYANLLLRLAVIKSDMPLVHNFVKSPIKERIKMLFNSKSKHMKKLLYLLALPIGMGLLWGFTVDVVDVVPKNNDLAISQDQPFIQRTNLKTDKGYTSEQITLNTVNGKPTNIKIGYSGEAYQKAELWVYVNHKLYSEEEAQKFNQDFIAKLPLKRGYSFATDFNIPAMGDEKNAYVFWFGNEPKLSDYTAKNRAYWEKYNGKTVEGKVIGYTFSPTSKVVDGFLVKTTNGETLKANVEAKFATQTQAMIGKNDQVSIKIYNSNYRKDTQYPVLTSYKISKGGKLLYDRWPKITTNTKPTNDETLNVAQNQQAKILSKPILLSSTRMTVDNKNEISYVKNGVMKIYGGELLADELTFDQKNKKVITKKATFTDKAGKVITGDMFTFDYEKGTYDVKAASGNSYPVNKKAGLINLDPIKYTATDSIITNKLTGDVFLYGNVKLLNNNQTYQSDRMVYNKVKQTLKVRDNLQMYDKMSNTYTKADSLYMNLKTGKGIFYRKTLLKFDR